MTTPVDVEATVAALCRETRAAARVLARAPKAQIDQALGFIAEELEGRRSDIIAANQLDLEHGKKQGLTGPLLERLEIKEKTFADLIAGVRQVQALSNPVGEILREWTQPNGLHFRKVRIPIGVIGIIYESRPNVTVDAAILCLKTGNGVVLRGGSEAFHSNQALTAALQAGLLRAQLPGEAVQLIPLTDRAAITALCHQDQTIDLLIPRGGQGLIETVAGQARMPVIKHYQGICHVYVHAEADLAMAEKIIVNAKCQRPSVCNSLETLLVDQAIAAKFIPQIVARLTKEKVELRGDTETQRLGGASIHAATEADWSSEYLDLILAVRIVADQTAAHDHIDRYGSHHSDTIVTANEVAARRFLHEVDSATVYWNASTRFTDGGQFGFGAEIGISTDKIHARGPMALDELTSYKYLIEGNGQVRE